MSQSICKLCCVWVIQKHLSNFNTSRCLWKLSSVSVWVHYSFKHKIHRSVAQSLAAWGQISTPLLCTTHSHFQNPISLQKSFPQSIIHKLFAGLYIPLTNLSHNTEPLCITGKGYLTISTLDYLVSGPSSSSGIPNWTQDFKTGSVPILRWKGGAYLLNLMERAILNHTLRIILNISTRVYESLAPYPGHFVAIDRVPSTQWTPGSRGGLVVMQ